MKEKSIQKNILIALLIFGFGILNLPAMGQILPLDPAVRSGQLPNGFTYYIRRNIEPKNRVVFYLANKVGSILETQEQRGLAHFMEHMNFNGTKHFPKNELVNYLQKSGVRFGADLNAYTGFDETVYQLPLPSDKPEILKKGIQIMRDWAQDASLETVEINKERGVIIEEKRLGKGASERIQRQTLPILLNQSRYASRIPIGTEDVILNAKPETLRDYYKDWYRPNLQALIVVGDINVTEMEKIIKAKFSDLKNPVKEKVRTQYTIPLTGKNQFLVVTDPEMTSTLMQVAIKHPASELKTVADYRASLLRGLFNQMLSERYAELSKKAEPVFLQGSAGITPLMGGLDMYKLSVIAKPGGLEKGFKAVWRESRRMQLFGFTLTELTRARQNYLSSTEAIVKEKDKVNSDVYTQAYLNYFLKQSAAPGIDKESELINRFIPQISLEQVNEFSKEYIREMDRDIIIAAPEKDKNSLPDEATVLNWIKEVNNEKMLPFEDQISKLPLLIGAPAGGKIVKEEKDTTIGITTLTLNNGVKVLLKKTDFKNNQILFTAFSAGGTSLYNENDFQSAVNAASIVAGGGIGNYNSTQLSKFLTGKQLGIRPYINDRTQGFAGNAAPKDLEAALQLLFGYFTEPRKDAEIFKGAIANAKSGLANRGDDPAAVFSDTVAAVLGNYNVRRTGPSLEKINQISLDKAFEIYKERFSDASGLTFVFVGSIDEETIKPLLAKYLGSLPSKGRKEEARDLGIHIPEGKIAKTVYKGTEQRSTVYLVYSGNYNYNLEDNVKMGALSEVLNIRMLERLREKEGGVYTPGVQLNFSKYPKGRFSLTVTFGCSPDNVESLIASASDEIKKVGLNGPSQENINKFKAEDFRAREIGLKTNEYWLSYLGTQLVNNEPLSLVDNYDVLINQVTVPSLKEISAKYLNGDNYIRLVLMPEVKGNLKK